MNPAASSLLDYANAVHRLAQFQAVDKLLPPDAPETLISELRRATIEARKRVNALREVMLLELSRAEVAAATGPR